MQAVILKCPFCGEEKLYESPRKFERWAKQHLKDKHPERAGKSLSWGRVRKEDKNAPTS